MNTRIAAFEPNPVVARIVELENRNLAYQEANRELTVELQRLQRLVYLDALTGLGNRRYFTRAIEAELQRAARGGSPLTVVLADIDAFKKCNETHGHAVGDELLRAAGEVLGRMCHRGGDLAARLGGDEFALLLPEVGQAAAQEFAAKLTAQPAPRVAGVDLSVTMSFGAAVFEGTRACGVRQLLDAADRALKRAKRAGGNRAEIVSIAMLDSRLAARPSHAPSSHPSQ